MPKGSQAKEAITQKILDVFPNSFKYDKEIRIPWIENNETLQIKCVLSCAKTNVSNDDEDDGIPFIEDAQTPSKPVFNGMNEPTDEEKATVDALLQKLGL